MLIVISRFKVQPGWRDKVESAFLARPRHVEEAPGFIGMDILQNADDPDQFWLYTKWQDERSYDTWHASHMYKKSHSGIPTGLKLVNEFTKIEKFVHLSS